jgi:hypothetical protein
MDIANWDTDGDGRNDQTGVDVDGDGTVDVWRIDTDRDGVANEYAADSNNDGKADSWVLDANEDGRLDGQGYDRDRDGRVDLVRYDVNQNGQLDGVMGDNNLDGSFDVKVADANENGIWDNVEPTSGYARTDFDADTQNLPNDPTVTRRFDQFTPKSDIPTPGPNPFLEPDPPDYDFDNIPDAEDRHKYDKDGFDSDRDGREDPYDATPKYDSPRRGDDD